MNNKINLPLPVKQSINFSSFIFILSFVSLVVLLIIYASSKGCLNRQLLILLIIFTVIIIAIYFTLVRAFQKKRMTLYIREERSRLLTSYYTINSQMDIIISLFMTLERVRRIENNSSLNIKYEKLRNYVYKMKESILNFNEYQAILQNPEDVDEIRLENLIKEINHNLYDVSKNIVAIVEDFTHVYSDSRVEIKDTNYNMATLVYFLSNIIPIISDLSSTSNKFSKNIIITVITQFEEIANFSSLITEDIQNTMKDLMDEAREDSLAYIIKKAHEVVQDFEVFFKSMEKLKSVSGNFVDTSITKLRNIADIAESIEEIAETIKVISLNVSIEAANAGSSGKGFQVLARDLREFAQKTRSFAQDVKLRVSDTILTTENLKDDYMRNMESVYKYVEEIKTSIVAFENIIINSFEKIKNIINTLKNFSSRISQGIKDIVGKLQYYDITSQEVEHLSKFIEQIFRKSSSQLHEFRIESILDTDKRQEIKRDILETIKEIITTKNEREIFNEYQRIFGFSPEEEPEDEEGTQTTVEGGGDDIVIF